MSINRQLIFISILVLGSKIVQSQEVVTTVTNPALGSENQNTTVAVSLAAATVATVVAPVAPETNTSEAVVGGAEQTGVTASVPAVVNVSSSTVLTPTSIATTGVNSISPQSSTSNTSIGTAVESVTLAAESIATPENANHVTNTSEKDANHTSENITNAAQSDNTTKELSSNSTIRPALLTSKLDLQTQLYIISGTFGAVVFLLILLVLTLALSVAKIKDQLCDSEARYIPSGKEQIHGYQNGAFNGGADVVRNANERSVDRDNNSDLKDLGYTIYNGKRNSSRENVYKVNDPMSTPGNQGESIPLDNVSNSGRRQMMKYEEGVIPMADEEQSQNYR